MEEHKKEKNQSATFTLAFIVPFLIGKCFIIYFGLNYSEFPGRGYGIGLAISIVFTICMFARFLWKTRNYKD